MLFSNLKPSIEILLSFTSPVSPPPLQVILLASVFSYRAFGTFSELQVTTLYLATVLLAFAASAASFLLLERPFAVLEAAAFARAVA